MSVAALRHPSLSHKHSPGGARSTAIGAELRLLLLQGSTALGCSTPGQEQGRGESIMPAYAFAHELLES